MAGCAVLVAPAVAGAFESPPPAWELDPSVTSGAVELALDRPHTPPAPGAVAPLPMIFGSAERPQVVATAHVAGPVTADVVDAAGGIVAIVTREALAPGPVALAWDGRDASGAMAPEGEYTLILAPGAEAVASAAPAPFEFRDHLFPVRGPHHAGMTMSNVFNSGHQGQDMFADCGTPVLAAQGGIVRFSGYEGAAGNYVVLHQTGDGQDAVYMHLRERPGFTVGERVATGARIGEVGRTGDADGCHLHFELWTAPGWYRGGHPHDPLPALTAWDGWS